MFGVGFIGPAGPNIPALSLQNGFTLVIQHAYPKKSWFGKKKTKKQVIWKYVHLWHVTGDPTYILAAFFLIKKTSSHIQRIPNPVWFWLVQPEVVSWETVPDGPTSNLMQPVGVVGFFVHIFLLGKAAWGFKVRVFFLNAPALPVNNQTSSINGPVTYHPWCLQPSQRTHCRIWGIYEQPQTQIIGNPHQKTMWSWFCLTDRCKNRMLMVCKSSNQTSSRHPINKQTPRQPIFQTHEKPIVRINGWIQAGFSCPHASWVFARFTWSIGSSTILQISFECYWNTANGYFLMHFMSI